MSSSLGDMWHNSTLPCNYWCHLKFIVGIWSFVKFHFIFLKRVDADGSLICSKWPEPFIWTCPSTYTSPPWFSWSLTTIANFSSELIWAIGLDHVRCLASSTCLVERSVQPQLVLNSYCIFIAWVLLDGWSPSNEHMRFILECACQTPNSLT